VFLCRSWHHHGAAGDFASAQRLISCFGLVQCVTSCDKRFQTKCSAFGQPENFRHVGARPRSIRSDYPQPASNKPGDFDRRGRASGGDANRNHSSAITEKIYRLRKRLRPPKDLESNVDSSASGLFKNGFRHVTRRSARRVDGVRCPEFLGDPKLFVVNIDRNDLGGPKGASDLDHVQANASTGHDSNLFTTL
jgi:hypothetical protein